MDALGPGREAIMLLRALLWQHRSLPSQCFRSRATAELYSGVPPRSRTNRETEVKLGVADASALLRSLARLRGVSHGRVFERNTLYDTPDSSLRRAGCLLRLRIETLTPMARGRGRLRAILASKAPLRSPSRRYKERLERERAIRKPRDWPRILGSLGFNPVFRYEKYRTTFRLPGLEMDLDETPVGTFLELEGAPGKIDLVARALGFSPRDYNRATYGELYAAYCRKHGRSPRNMLFPH
jgi:adenylate cyclase class 2